MKKDRNDFELLDDIESCISSSYDTAYNACSALRQRLEKLHFYEYVYFNGRDSDEARRLKPCMNDERDFIKLDLESI